MEWTPLQTLLAGICLGVMGETVVLYVYVFYWPERNHDRLPPTWKPPK